MRRFLLNISYIEFGDVANNSDADINRNHDFHTKQFFNLLWSLKYWLQGQFCYETILRLHIQFVELLLSYLFHFAEIVQWLSYTLGKSAFDS
jgi:hypothetical protein